MIGGQVHKSLIDCLVGRIIENLIELLMMNAGMPGRRMVMEKICSSIVVESSREQYIFNTILNEQTFGCNNI